MDGHEMWRAASEDEEFSVPDGFLLFIQPTKIH